MMSLCMLLKHMAIVCSSDHGWVICHDTLIRNVYKETRHEGECVSYGLNPVLFDIYEPFRIPKNQNVEYDEEVKVIEEAYKSLYELYSSKQLHINNDTGSNREARCLANKFYKECFHYPNNPILGGNNNGEPVIHAVNDENYLFPANCTFYSHDIKDVNKHLNGKLFHFILLDPPWWNKFIRRKRKMDSNFGYNMLYDNDLKNIPVNNLLHDDGFIGIWCTSAPSHIQAVLTILFPEWKIKFISQWFWLKVTKKGAPICGFSEPCGKQPYERIIFGIKNSSSRTHGIPENNKVIMSVPSAIHSHKPPICELLKPYLPVNAECLELFARYLLPKWTSFGNEVIKLQHISLYDRITQDSKK